MYFGLAQILPISFAQTLFFLNVLLHDLRQTEYQPNRPPAGSKTQEQNLSPALENPKGLLALRAVSTLLPVIYAVLIYMAPRVLEHGIETSFVIIIFALRALLFIPYPFMITCHQVTQQMFDVFWTVFLPIAFGDMAMKTWGVTNFGEDGIKHTIQLIRLALGRGSAVAALGWDVLIAMVSLVVWGV